MSDESSPLISSLNKRIAELEGAKANLEVALRGERKDRKALKEKLDSLVEQADGELTEFEQKLATASKERDDLAARLQSSPSEHAARIEDLEGQIRTRDHRDAWKEAVGKELQPKATVEHVWRELDYKPGDKVPTPDEINALVAQAKEKADYLFVPPAAPGNGATSQGTARPPLKVADSSGRGARDVASGTVPYSRSEVQAPGWMRTPRGKAIQEARDNGTAVLTGD